MNSPLSCTYSDEYTEKSLTFMRDRLCHMLTYQCVKQSWSNNTSITIFKSTVYDICTDSIYFTVKKNLLVISVYWYRDFFHLSSLKLTDMPFYNSSEDELYSHYKHCSIKQINWFDFFSFLSSHTAVSWYIISSLLITNLDHSFKTFLLRWRNYILKLKIWDTNLVQHLKILSWEVFTFNMRWITRKSSSCWIHTWI